VNIFSRAAKSIRLRGVIGTGVLVLRALGIYLSKLEDSLFDVRYRTDTGGRVELSDLMIASENKDHGVRYEPTRARPFKKLINMLDLPRDSTFVDFGSGKGRVLIMALECGFRKVVGLEFSQELCEISRKNLATSERKRKF
jgi:SAM-dependent methyltransferase